MKRMNCLSRRFTATVLLLALFASLTAASAFADFDSALSALNAEKEAATQKRISAQNKVRQLKSEQNAIIEEKMALEEKNNAAAMEIYVLEQEIALFEQEIATYDQKIADKQLEVQEAADKENTQLEKYRARIRAMEEGNESGILTIILNSDSFPAMLAAIDDYGEIMESDVRLYDELQDARAEHERIEAEYEEYRSQCEQVKDDYNSSKEIVEAEKAELEKQIAESEAIIQVYAEQIKEAEAEQAAMEAAEASAAAAATNFMQQYYMQKQTAAMTYENAVQAAAAAGTAEEQAAWTEVAQQAAAAMTGGGAVGSGAFAWPFPGHSVITSTFGYRGSTGSYHTGVDIDGYQSMGSPIVAADTGTVIKAEYYGGYGNCVIIDHGNSYSTLYAHLSSMSVGYGSVVSRGQTIGGVGNTGTCYGLDGVHLHFEVMINGQQVDPLAYIGGYGYTLY